MAEAELTAELARKKALAMLARREHSQGELHAKLAAKGFPEGMIDDALSGLDREGWLSDVRFVEAYIRARRERGYGPVRIRAELRARGIAEEMIADHLDLRDPQWMQVLQRAWARRVSGKMEMDYTEQARHMRFFQMRGFTTEQIRAVVNR